MNLYIFIISVVRPAGTRNPPEIRGCGCGCKNAPAGLLAGGFFPIPRVCLRAGFRQTRTRTRGCHPYLRSRWLSPFDLLKHRNVRFIVALNNVAICVFLIVLQYNYNLFYFNHHELWIKYYYSVYIIEYTILFYSLFSISLSRTYCFMSINHHKCTIHMLLLLQAVCNYRRSPKHHVKHGTVEWSKMVLWNGQIFFLMTGRIVEFHFRNVKWYFLFGCLY